MQSITIAYFACPTPQGTDLFQQLQKWLQTAPIPAYRFSMTLRPCTQTEALCAYLCDDLIIFDASLEGETEPTSAVSLRKDAIGSQYDAFFETLKASVRTFIVSRTAIPFNITSVRQGGYPQDIATGICQYQETLENREILQWLMQQFTLRDMPLLNPRKFARAYVEQHLNDTAFQKILMQYIVEDAEESRHYQRTFPKAFISYLSKYSKFFQKSGSRTATYTVENLLSYIPKITHLSQKQIGYFPPGRLCTELMTLQRRWEIVAATDEYLRNCEQFWIFQTPDYAKSWWTLSEFITLAYILSSEPDNCPSIYIATPKWQEGKATFSLRIYDTVEKKKRLLPQLSPAVFSEIARFFSNSRVGTVGYESQVPMHILHKMPKPLLFGVYKFMGHMEQKLFPDLKSSMHMNLEKDTFADFYQSTKSVTYSNAFWEDWILECPYCKYRFFEKWDMCRFLYPRNTPFCHSIQTKHVYYEPDRKLWSYTCINCTHTFYFKLGYRYRWWSMRGGVHTSPTKTSIEKIETLYFVHSAPEKPHL